MHTYVSFRLMECVWCKIGLFSLWLDNHKSVSKVTALKSLAKYSAKLIVNYAYFFKKLLIA